MIYGGLEQQYRVFVEGIKVTSIVDSVYSLPLI